MKIVSITLIALTGIGLAAAPCARAQSSPASNSAVEGKIKSMEDAWEAAETQKDHGASVVGDMLASDYNGVGSPGTVRNKTEQLEHMRSDTDTYTSASNSTMNVHVYSPDLATVTGTSVEKGKDKDGKEFDRTYAWVDTWMQRNGKWECIASGGTPVEKK